MRSPDLGATGAIMAASRIREDANLTVDAAETPLLFHRSLLRRILAGRLHDVDTRQRPDPNVYRAGELFVAHPHTAALLRARVRARLR